VTPTTERRAALLMTLLLDLRQRSQHTEADRVRLILRRVIGKGACAQRAVTT
jgi:hypothetical protein